MYQIKASIDHLSEGVATFDPMYVLAKLRAEFPDLDDDFEDHLLATCRQIASITGDRETGAMRTAVKDLYERGPALRFEIPVGENRKVKGVVERYWILVSSKEPFPVEFEQKFVAFLKSLWMQQPEIQVKSE